MTPEELNRTIEFLVRHQAQFSVDLERDHEMLNRGFTEMHTGFAETRNGFVEMHRGFAEMHEAISDLKNSMKGLAGVQKEMALNHQRIAELIEIETQRLDRIDRILDRLTGNNQKPN